MIISRSYGAYNPRRYSKPWIAKITDVPVGKNPILQFGSCIQDNPGDKSVIEISANIGDVIRWGQKDYRSNKTEIYTAIVQADGSLVDCSLPDAIKHIRAAVSQ